MWKRIYWNLLVVFGVLCQGIIGTLSEEDIDKSSELLVREKRVINRWPGGDIKEPIKNFPYIVSIKQFRAAEFCAGVILTLNTVLTIAKCVSTTIDVYRVYSGTSVVSSHSHPVVHQVTSKRINTGHHLFRPYDGLALITVNPPFIYSKNTKNIELYQGHVEPGTYGIVSGWGFNSMGDPETEYPERLRSIKVPIISKEDCIMLYLRNFAISDSDICTFDATEKQYCGVDDAGSPLVFKVGGVDKLVGIHLWNGGVVGRCNPDVFVNLQYPPYKTWIIETIHSLEQAHLNNLHHNQQLLHNPHHQNLHSLPHV